MIRAFTLTIALSFISQLAYAQVACEPDLISKKSIEAADRSSVDQVIQMLDQRGLSDLTARYHSGEIQVRDARWTLPWQSDVGIQTNKKTLILHRPFDLSSAKLQQLALWNVAFALYKLQMDEKFEAQLDRLLSTLDQLGDKDLLSRKSLTGLTYRDYQEWRCSHAGSSCEEPSRELIFKYLIKRTKQLLAVMTVASLAYSAVVVPSQIYHAYEARQEVSQRLFHERDRLIHNIQDDRVSHPEDLGATTNELEELYKDHPNLPRVPNP